EPQWRNLTAMDKYYENGPLPTWLGWHVQQWPHGFHAFSAGATLAIELFVAWLVFFPKWSRRICFFITTPLQIGIILTANYAFLNYLVMFLGVLLVDDGAPRPSAAAEGGGSPHRPSYAAAIVLPILFITTIASFLMPSFATVRLLEPF